MSLHEALHELFIIDQQFQGLEGRLSGAKAHVRGQQAKIDALQAQIDETTDKMKHTQAHEANLENEANAVEERVTHLREQMNSAKTNKEYSAFLVEVNTLKADKSKLEEEAIKQFDIIDGLKNELEELEEKLAEQNRIKEIADKELAQREAEVADQLAQVTEKRARAAEQVPVDALAIFEKLIETADGEPMAKVVQEDPRRMEYICDGCYIQIPPELVNRLFTTDTLIRCSTCTRILYLDSEMKAKAGAK